MTFDINYLIIECFKMDVVAHRTRPEVHPLTFLIKESYNDIQRRIVNTIL